MNLLKQLQEIENQLSSLQNKKPCKIIMAPAAKEAMHIKGMFLAKDNVILINDNVKKIDTELLFIISHESRHSYQWQVANNEIKAALIDYADKWGYELLNPNNAASNATDDELKAYITRSSELDANAFGEMILQVRYPNLKMGFPEFYRPLIESRKKELLKVYFEDVINDLKKEKAQN